MARPHEKSVAEIVQELFDLLKAYAQQETLEPFKRLGVYLAWGGSGSALMSVGVFFVALSALRALQTQTGSTFAGPWSWVPYFIVAVGLGLVIGLAVWKITRSGPREHEGAR
ncbi:MAG TPA: phage holin family protein [Acidimicrobiales bacterium]|nr:phage holin family protein [Acidimicrobiales bacterium]